MKKQLLIVFTACLMSTLSFAQFAEMDFIPRHKTGISKEDYQRGKYFLVNTYQSIREHENNWVYADYWNVAVAYQLMRVHRDSILGALQTSQEMDTEDFCSIVSHMLEKKNGPKDTKWYATLGDDFLKLVQPCQTIHSTGYSRSEEEDKKEALDLTGLDEPLINRLIALMDKDQRYRKLGEDYDANWAEQTQLDKEIQDEMESIFTTYGYPGRSLVGKRYMSYACLMLEHGGEIAYQEKWFPIVIEAMQAGEVDRNIVRMLIDRIHWKKTGKQIFGSHVGVSFDAEEVVKDVKEKYGL